MKKIIWIMVFMLSVSNTVYAGSYTLTTTAVQDTKLAIVAAADGTSIGVLLQNILVDNISSKIKAIDDQKRLDIKFAWGNLTDAQKAEIAAIINP